MWWLIYYLFFVVVILGLVFILASTRSPPPVAPPPLVVRTKPAKVSTKRIGKKYVVTGGHGMLGSHIVEALLARGEDDVTIFDALESPLFKKERDEGKVKFVRGNLVNPADVAEAIRGADTVFHTAALVNYWSRLARDYQKIYDVNVNGTKNVVAACLEGGVRQLIHTSTMSLYVIPGYIKNPMRNVKESDPVPNTPPLCHYTSTKYLAEKAALEANGKKGLLVAAVRPNGIYGPRDQLLAAIMPKGDPGIGTYVNKQDYTYVENLVHGMLCIEDKLVSGSNVAGQAYFISNGQPTSYFDFNSKFYELYGHKFKIMPYYFVNLLAYVSETLQWIGGGRIRLGQLEKLTPATLALSRAEMYATTDKAKKDLGWSPIYTEAEGMKACFDYEKAVAEERKKLSSTSA